MYVRWKKRQLRKEQWDSETRRYLPPPTLLSAVLVENVRVDGKPRQRLIRYLGSVRDNKLSGPYSDGHRLVFWRSVDHHLDELALPTDARAAIEATIAGVAPRPTAAEVEAVERRWAAIHRMGRSAPAPSVA